MEKTIKKLSKTVGRRTYRHGQWYKATIDGKECVGRISIADNKIFLCQNTSDGSDTPDKLGFMYSWVVGAGSDRELKVHNAANLKLLSRKPAGFRMIKRLPQIGSYVPYLINDGETIKVGCTPVSRELYLEVGREAGWIE